MSVGHQAPEKHRGPIAVIPLAVRLEKKIAIAEAAKRLRLRSSSAAPASSRHPPRPLLSTFTLSVLPHCGATASWARSLRGFRLCDQDVHTNFVRSIDHQHGVSVLGAVSGESSIDLRAVFSRAVRNRSSTIASIGGHRFTIDRCATDRVDFYKDVVVLKIFERTSLGDGRRRLLFRWLGNFERLVEDGCRRHHEEQHGDKRRPSNSPALRPWPARSATVRGPPRLLPPSRPVCRPSLVNQ